MKALLGFILTITLFGAYSAASDICGKQETCNECVTASSDCSWCTDSGYRGHQRCDTPDNLKTEKCPEQRIYSLKPEVKIDRNIEFGEALPVQGGTVVNQLKPQGVQVSVSPGKPAVYQLEYAHTTDIKDITVVHSTRDEDVFKLDYMIDCHGRWINSNQCQQVKKDQHVKINISVALDPSACKPGKKKGTIAAGVSVTSYRQMSGLWIHPICECECSKLQLQEINSRRCSLHGNLVCGQCSCSRGWMGKYCRCQVRDGETKDDVLNRCKNKNGVVCSGNGDCECGRCRCRDQLFKGEFCECDNAACPAPSGILCSGKGECKCGNCECIEGWSGVGCECTNSVDDCRASNENICNNHGRCTCGKCECEAPYTGPKCEDMPGAPKATTTPQSEPEPEPDKESEAEKEKEGEGSAEQKPSSDKEDDGGEAGETETQGETGEGEGEPQGETGEGETEPEGETGGDGDDAEGDGNESDNEGSKEAEADSQKSPDNSSPPSAVYSLTRVTLIAIVFGFTLLFCL